MQFPAALRKASSGRRLQSEGHGASGSKVLVEGIETPEQLVVAISAGADHLQGFLLARPALAGTDNKRACAFSYRASSRRDSRRQNGWPCPLF